MSKIGLYVLDLMSKPLMIECPECGGAGEYEVDVPMPHNAGRDVGYLDSRWETCEMCEGEGVVEKTCPECGEMMTEWDTKYDPEETICSDCKEPVI